jgi:hypothetical protein
VLKVVRARRVSKECRVKEAKPETA